MVSRREMLLALAAGAVAVRRGAANVLTLEGQAEGTPVDFPVPRNACDCHVHVFGDAARFPMSPERGYTPPPAPVEDARRHLGALHMTRVVIVSASVYGTNNDCALDAIRHLGVRARGVASRAPPSPTCRGTPVRRAALPAPRGPGCPPP